MKPARYRKKPVVIEAMQFDGANHLAFCDFFAETEHEHFDCGGCHFLPDGESEDGEEPELPGGVIQIPTLEGRMTAEVGDWVIKGVAGEYPCKPDIFDATYEPADGAP